MRRDLDPHRNTIRAAKPHQVVADGAVALEPFDEVLAGLLIDEPVRLERLHLVLWRVGREAEHQLQVRVRGDRARLRTVERPDEDPLVDGLEQACERFGRGVDHLPAVTGGVGVIVGYDERYFASIPRRMAAMSAPDEYICIASRATSRQIPQVAPCGTQAVTRPAWSRAATKQSSLLRCPMVWQPQKQGTLDRISG